MNYVCLDAINSKDIRHKILSASYDPRSLSGIHLGIISLDEILDEFQVYDINNQFTEDQLQAIYAKCNIIDEIINTYLNQKEKTVFKLYIYSRKKICEIMSIMDFDSWRISYNNVNRVSIIIRLYYNFIIKGRKNLDEELKNHFNNFELRILELLEHRHIIYDVTKMINKEFNENLKYMKMQRIVAKIMSKLENGSTSMKNYFKFLSKIRKYKNIND